MSSEDFKSLIVTDPDLIDEGIDVSGLRTTTDTNRRLLGSISDYPGISYDPTSYSYLSDLNRLFASGLQGIDTSQPATPPSSGGGGGGENTSPGTGGGGTTPGTNTPEEQRLIDEGIGLQIGPGQPVFAPGEMPVTQDDIDNFNQMPVNTDYTSTPTNVGNPFGYGMTTSTGGSPGTLNPVTYADTGSPDLYEQAGGLTDGIEDLGFQTDYYGEPNLDAIDLGNPMGDKRIVSEEQETQGAPSYIDPIMDPNLMAIRQQQNYTPEQENTVKNIFGKVGDDVSLALTELGKLPGAIVDATNKTVNVFGKKIDVGKTIGGLILNKMVGGPATFVIEFLKNVLPEQDPRVGKLNEFYSTGEGSKYMDPNSANYIPGMDQYNTVSGGALYTLSGGQKGTPVTYGLQGAYQKRIDRVEKTLADKYNMTDADIADIKAGTYTNEEDIETDLIQRLVDLQNAKKEEADMLGITAAEEKRQKELEFKDFFAGNKDQDSVDKFDTTPTTTPFDADTFDDDVTLTDGGFRGQRDYSKVNYLDPSNFSTIKPGGTVLEDDFESLVDTPTGIDTGIKLGPQELDQDLSTLGDDLSAELDDILGTNITGDSTLVATDPLGVTTKLLEQKDKIEAIKKSDAYEVLSQEQKDKLEEDLDKINQDLKLEEIKEQTAGLITMTDGIDTSGDDPIDTGPVTTGSGNNPFGYTDPTPPSAPPKDTGGDSGGQGGGADMGTAPKGGTYDAEAEDDQYEAPAPTPTPDFYDDPITTGGGGNQGDPGCFIKGTLITMADKTTKPVEQVDLEDEVAVGGKVFAVGRFLNTELYDYKGIKVSGSHMVNEEGVWMRVRDTKHGKSLGDDKHTVYVFGSENRRILINGILFTDYFEVKDQEQLLKKENKFFDDWKTFANNEDQKNVDTLNAV
jgi:hypothetical protein